MYFQPIEISLNENLSKIISIFSIFLYIYFLIQLLFFALYTFILIYYRWSNSKVSYHYFRSWKHTEKKHWYVIPIRTLTIRKQVCFIYIIGFCNVHINIDNKMMVSSHFIWNGRITEESCDFLDCNLFLLVLPSCNNCDKWKSFKNVFINVLQQMCSKFWLLLSEVEIYTFLEFSVGSFYFIFSWTLPWNIRSFKNINRSRSKSCFWQGSQG